MAPVIASIKSVFYAEFHPVQGPMISIQVPREDSSEEKRIDYSKLMDEIAEYLIPKQDLCGHLTTM